MRRNVALCIIILLISMLFASCKTTEEPPLEEDVEQDKIEIGITFDTFVLERWIRDRDVFVSTATGDSKAVVDVQNANGDIEKQRRQIQKFIEQKKDVIVIVAVDCFSLTEVVTDALKQGIKIISYDRLIQNVETSLYITVDNTRVGEEMAKEVKESLPDGGNIVMICGPEMDTNSADVSNGFEKLIDKDKYEIIYKNHVKSWTPENGFNAVTEAFNAVGEENIDAVMCGNDGLAGYVIRALSEKQLAGKVIVVGQDADLDACQRVVEGTQAMTVFKPIEELAKVAAECAISLAEGKSVENISYAMQSKALENGDKIAYLGLEPTAVRRDNMDRVIIDSGFHLKEEVYLNMQ